MAFAMNTSLLRAANVLPDDIVVCPYQKLEDLTLRENITHCQPISVHSINPQNTEIWVFGTLTITPDLLSQAAPLALFISAKASTTAYLNGQLLGRNGVPGPEKNAEVPGIMDTAMYVPIEKLKLGRNEFALHMSSHHGLLTLRSPVHFVGIAEHVNPTNETLSHYWPSLLPFGALLIGALYMGLLALVKRDHWSVALLPLMSLVGAAQLYAEVYRGLVAYSYPTQDLRLILILACSFIFGLCLAAHVIWSLNIKYKVRFFLLTLVLTLGAVIAATGFDTMSAFALFIPAMIGLILALSRLPSREPQALTFSAILGFFLLSVILAPAEFLNVTFFYILAALMVILFINEIRSYTEERKARLKEQAQANKLQTILEQNQKRDTSETINVGSAGKLEVVSIANIIYCKGAGDYAELILEDGRSLLHSERLAELEKTLPSIFLRVHRSYIVNSGLINSLTRKPSGVGELAMADNSIVPVSRRIMPSVRTLL